MLPDLADLADLGIKSTPRSPWRVLKSLRLARFQRSESILCCGPASKTPRTTLQHPATPCILGQHHIVTTTRKNSFPQGKRWARIGKQNIAKPHRSQVDWTWLNCLLSCWDLNRTSGYSVKLSPITLDAQCSRRCRLCDTAVTLLWLQIFKDQRNRYRRWQHIKHMSNIGQTYLWPMTCIDLLDPVIQSPLPHHCVDSIAALQRQNLRSPQLDHPCDKRRSHHRSAGHGTGTVCGGMPAMGTSPQLTANHYDFVRPHLSDFEAKISELIKQLSRFPYKSKQLKKTRRICPNPSKLT